MKQMLYDLWLWLKTPSEFRFHRDGIHRTEMDRLLKEKRKIERRRRQAEQDEKRRSP